MNDCILKLNDDQMGLVPQSIKIILEDYPKIIDYLFNLKKAELNQSSKELIEGAKAFSSGEQILIKIALDFWDSSGDVLLRDIYQKLPSCLWRKIFNAVAYAESGN